MRPALIVLLLMMPAGIGAKHRRRHDWGTVMDRQDHSMMALLGFMLTPRKLTEAGATEWRRWLFHIHLAN